MATRYGLSPWIHAIPKTKQPSFPRLKGDHDVPVLIVGGGLTGVCTAYALAAAGIKATLVEADRLGWAGSGRASGLVSGEPTASYSELEQRHGRRAARAMFEASRRAVLDLAATIRRLRIQSRWTPAPAVRYVPRFDQAAAMQREATLRKGAGLDAAWRRPVELSRELALASEGGARLGTWGWTDPYRLLLGFAAAAARRGAALHERTTVRRIRNGRQAVEITTDTGRITAGTVIVCTGTPGPLFRSLARHVTPVEDYAVLTAPLPASMRKGLGRTRAVLSRAAQPGERIAFADDNRLVLTGGAQKPTPARGREKVLVQRTGQLMYELLTTWPVIAGLQPVYGWDVPSATTADGVMFAGAHRNFPRHLFAWATGHDPAQAFLASRVLLRHVLDTPEKSDQYFAFTRG
ncbi:MAG: NAD(P)/FAD-dependent oxidoreductase [Vicinamibacterales bacterium]